MQAIRRVFFWLSGAGTDALESCPTWEQRKYVAFGATVLVPTVFAFIACSYALSTLTDNWRVIIGVSLIWSFIIMTIDRALLASYRPYLGFFRKSGQFSLRFVVALLMGVTISHPLTLLLFRDTITAEIERERDTEITDVRASALVEKTGVEARMRGVEAEIALQREKWDVTFDASFLDHVRRETGAAETAEGGTGTPQAVLNQAADAVAPIEEKIAGIDAEMETLDGEFRRIQDELAYWQREFEREVNGQRSGIVGLGPRAKSIQEDHLNWRRAEAARLSGLLEARTAEKNTLREDAAKAEAAVLAEFESERTEALAREKAERDRLDGLRRQVDQEQADQFVVQQNRIRETIAKQIDAGLADVERLRTEITRLEEDERQRIALLRAEPRRDILTQTLALHRLFRAGDEGGTFAIICYAVLTLLFMLVDTIPLVVKFFSKPGPYDTLLDRDEIRFEKDHEAFVKNYVRYVDELSEGTLTRITRSGPLEKALIEGIERSRAAKEFVEVLMEMERTFEERVRREKERVAAGAGEPGMLEEIAEAFYGDLRRRMEEFFIGEGDRRATT
ncbi:MAG TPA: DUF4407 domain-containing protein [Verrucomicrobiales bacterium]|nr:DUF4407 domain-containing protein [Verrucomicrobiales bacterium]